MKTLNCEGRKPESNRRDGCTWRPKTRFLIRRLLSFVGLLLAFTSCVDADEPKTPAHRLIVGWDDAVIVCGPGTNYHTPPPHADGWRLDGHEQNHEVEGDTPVAEVEEIEAPIGRKRGIVAPLDLPKSGDARPDRLSSP